MAQVLIPPFGGATVLNQQQTIAGNTAGASTWSGTNQVFEAGSNITLSVTGNTLVIQGGGSGTAPPFTQSTQPVAYSALNGSALFSTLQFADSGGVSWSTGSQGIYVGSLSQYVSARSNAWNLLGVYVSSNSPSNPVYYTDWIAGSAGYWAWVSLVS